MKAYKFIEGSFVGNIMLGGSLRLSLLSHFRIIENNELRDEMEGISGGYISDFIYIEGDTQSQTVANRLAASGAIKLAPGATDITFKNISVRTRLRIDPYVLCLSLDSSIKKWTSGPHAKDCIVEVTDIEALARIIADSHRNLLTGQFAIKEVSYTKKDADLLKENLLEPNPFEKPEKYKEENELRMIFEPLSLNPAPHFNTICPLACPLFRLSKHR